MVSLFLYAENAKNYRIDCFDIVENGSKGSRKTFGSSDFLKDVIKI